MIGAAMRFEKTFEIRWSDLDPNRHLRHSAYADFATHVRIRYLAENGFPLSRLQELAFGPVITLEEIRYLREVDAEERVAVDFRVAGLAPRAAAYALRHDVRRSDGILAATLRIEGGWLDLATRRLRDPPVELAALLEGLERTEDFSELPPRR